MTTGVTHDQGISSSRPFLSAVTSLNVQRRDDALYLLAREHGKPLTPYDICKTQVLADVFHLIATGKVVFGGKLYAMNFGPVEKSTLDACERWALGLFLAGATAANLPADQQPLEPSGWTGHRNHIPEFRASSAYGRSDVASWDDFADVEANNIRRAFDMICHMSWNQSQHYFHDPVSAIGYAYNLTTEPFGRPFKGRVEMNWFDVLDGAEKIEGADVSYSRDMLRLWIQE